MATKINLRKAAALQTILHDLIKTIVVTPVVRINEFQDPATIINEASAVFYANDTRRNDLMMSIYSIRSQVGVQNAMCGVSNKLGHIAYIDRRISQLTDMVSNAEKVQEIAVITGKLDKIRNRPADSRASFYGGERDEVETGIMTEDQIASIQGVIRDLKRQKSNINDEILELNVRTEFDLTPEVESVLQREGLI